MAMIDYGAVVFKNGRQINHDMFMDMQEAVGWESVPYKGNYFAYVGDRELTFCFYKHYCGVVVNGRQTQSLYGADCSYNDRGHMSYRGEANGIPYHIRNVGGRNVWLFSARYKGDTYNVIYGYGIDVDRKCWNRIKVRYLGRKASRAVDRLYTRFSTDR